MWKCQKCEKPVFFAERRHSVGFDWHRVCLRCEECSKVLNPGQHAEHKGIPYCHIPCYSALFGPKLFGHGSTVGLHRSFGKRLQEDDSSCQIDLQRKVKSFNEYYEQCCEGKGISTKSSKYFISSRQVNGRLVLEGVLRLYWQITGTIKFVEYNDKRPIKAGLNKVAGIHNSAVSLANENVPVFKKSRPLSWPHSKSKQISMANQHFDEKVKQHASLLSNNAERRRRSTGVKCLSTFKESPRNLGNRCLRRTAGKIFDNKLRRTGSINGHLYDRGTSVCTPPVNSSMSVWISSLITCQDVIKLVLEKYQIETETENFGIFVAFENGERRLVVDSEFPLLLRVNLGPRENIAKLCLMDRMKTQEIGHNVAQFINLSIVECREILNVFFEEEEKKVEQIRFKYETLRRALMEQINKFSKISQHKT